MTVLNRLPMSKHLKALIADRTTIATGLSSIPRVPSEADPDTFVSVPAPYFILYPLWVNLSGPPFVAPEADAEWIYQVTAIAEKGDQLEWMRDKVLTTVLGRSPSGAFVVPIEVAGMRVMDRSLKEDGGMEPGSMESTLRFALKVTPTT